MSKQVNTKVNVESEEELSTLQESANIKNFINSISSKNYALAHKYLQQVIDSKLKARIATSLDKPLF
jgi:hypothetical protein